MMAEQPLQGIENLHTNESLLRENVELTAQLAQRSAELRNQIARVESLEHEASAFEYAMSHDLRAPLRGIDGFTHAVLEDYGDRLDEEGQNYLAHVCRACVDMGNMIDDLAELASVSRSPIRREWTDVSHMVQSITEDIRRREPHRDIQFTVKDGVHAEADAHLLRIALQHLFDNSWKFTGKHRTAVVQFGTVEDNDTRVFFVSDDGAGFDPAYADKLFGAFQRLHTAEEFPGRGIGLVTVQRIISRHGGRAWATGEVEKGTTVYFTLECAPAHAIPPFTEKTSDS